MSSWLLVRTSRKAEMQNSSPLSLVQVSSDKKLKKKTYRHCLEFASNRKIYSLYLWGVRETRASIRLSLLTHLVWSRLHSAKRKSQFCFVFPFCSCAKPLFLTTLLLKSAFPSFQFCSQFFWKEAHWHIWDTNHRKGGMVLSFQKTEKPKSQKQPI